MLEVKDVSICVNTRYLIKGLSFTLNKGDKLAIIGEEGNGKSTLLRCLLGICDYATVTGMVSQKNYTIGYLEQLIQDKQTVFDFLFSNQEAYYNKIHELYQYLETFQLKEEILKQSMSTLSGGEKVKIGILRLLLEECDILFLDEPTNDLDIETLEWLEMFMKQTNKPILYISHDETLLASTANRILHIEQLKKKQECKHTLMNVDYQTYIDMRINSIQKQTQVATFEKREYTKKEEKLRRVMQKVEYRQNTISRSDPHGAKVLKKKMHTLKSQEKKLNESALTEMPDVEESIHFSFEEVNIPKNKLILEISLERLEVGQQLLAQNIYLEVRGNVHLCIIGKNGVGKTTLIQKIYDTLCTRTDIKVGYMPQNYETLWNPQMTVLDFVAQKQDITKARMYLGNMKFTQEEMTGKIEDLSNGTKAKLMLMKFVLEQCDVLVLDEPTRNVSPLSNPMIRTVLKNFKGTIISVSHDRKYIEEVADVIYLLDASGLTKINK